MTLPAGRTRVVSPPPDPETRIPAIVVPEGACDCHIHVFEAARFPCADGRGYDPPEATARQMETLHARLGIARAVLTQASAHGIDNRAVLDAVAAAPDSRRAIVGVNSDTTDAELRRLHEAGARGFRVNLVDPGGMPFGGLDEIRHMAARVAPLGWHAEFLVHVHDAPDFAALARSLPIDAVVGHLGYMSARCGLDHPGWDAFLGLVEEGRCWVKLTGPYRITQEPDLPYGDVAPYAWALADTRPDRLLWGSDWPHVMIRQPMPNDAAFLDLLGEWVPDEAARRRILVDNPARLYGFSP